MYIYKFFIVIVVFLYTNLYAININQFINNRECNQTVNKEFFKICYDYNYKAAKAVGYTLYGDLVNENNIDKRPSFKIERAIERQYRASTKDYTNSRLQNCRRLTQKKNL